MPSIIKKLKAGLLLLASHLPEEKSLVGEVATGAQCLAENPASQRRDGRAIDPQASYRRLVPKGQVNHGRRLVKAYEQGGRAGVLAYCKKYIEPQHFDGFATKLSQLVPA